MTSNQFSAYMDWLVTTLVTVIVAGLTILIGGLVVLFMQFVIRQIR